MRRGNEGRVLPWWAQLVLFVVLCLAAFWDSYRALAGAITPLPGGTSGGAGTVTDVTGQDGIAVNGIEGVPFFTTITITPSYGVGDTTTVTSTSHEGTTNRIARSDHRHQGVHAIAAGAGVSASGAYGDVTVSLTSSGVTPGVYGDATNIPQFTVDVYGRVTLSANVPVSIPSGNVTLTGANGILVNGASTPQVGTTFTIAPTYGMSVQPPGTTGSAGVADSASRSDHQHPGPAFGIDGTETAGPTMTFVAGAAITLQENVSGAGRHRLTITNNGVTSLAANQGLAVSAASGAVTLTPDSSTLTPTWTNIQGKPGTFAPSAHAPSHRPGGGDALDDTYTVTTRAITAGAYLTGGGNFSADRTLAVLIGSVSADVTPTWAHLQNIDPEIAAIAGLTSAADTVPYFTGSGTAALATFTAAGRAIVGNSTAADQRATLGFPVFSGDASTFLNGGLALTTPGTTLTGTNGITIDGSGTAQPGAAHTIAPTYGSAGEIQSLATSNAAGTTDKFARIDHAHASPFFGINGTSGLSTYLMTLSANSGIVVSESRTGGVDFVYLTPDSSVLTPTWANIQGKPSTFTPAAHAPSHRPAAAGGTDPLDASYTTTASFTAHTGASSGVHGVTGSVVGTTDTQILTNKTLNDTSNFIDADAIHRKVRNQTGSTLTKGQAVYVNGWDVGGACVTVALARADSASTMPAAGLIEADIINNAYGELRMNGILSGFDTSATAPATSLYVSASSAGALTATRPTAAAIVQNIARVGRQHVNQGTYNILPQGQVLAPNFTGGNVFWYGGADGTITEASITAAGRALVAAADAPAQRTVMGVTQGVSITVPGGAHQTGQLNLTFASTNATVTASTAGVTTTVTITGPVPGLVSGGYVRRVGTNLLYAPQASNRLYLLSGGIWKEKIIPAAGITAACSPTSIGNTTAGYVYVSDNSGLTLTVTTTAPVTSTSDGIWTMTGDAGQLLLAYCYTNGAGGIDTWDTTNVSASGSYHMLSNLYNKQPITAVWKCVESDVNTVTYQGNWTPWVYNTSFRVGVLNDGNTQVFVEAYGTSFGGTGIGAIGIGIDSTTANSALMHGATSATGYAYPMIAQYIGKPAAGFHYYQMLMGTYSSTAGAAQFYNDTPGTTGVDYVVRTGIRFQAYQ